MQSGGPRPSGSGKRQRRTPKRPKSPARDSLERVQPIRGIPYLFRKRIAPEGLWQAGSWLLVPMTDPDGVLWNLQRIPPEEGAAKLFLKGGRTKRLFWRAGEAIDRLVIGEGVATVAAVRRATGLPVVAAMTAGNLPDVTEAIHAKRPDLILIIAADDDEPGHKAARLASARTGALVVLPGDCTHG